MKRRLLSLLYTPVGFVLAGLVGTAFWMFFLWMAMK